MARVLSKSQSLLSKHTKLFIFPTILFFLCIIHYSYRTGYIHRNSLSADCPNKLTDMLMSQHCFLQDIRDRSIASLYYRHATSARNSSYPFISGDTFRAFADYVFDETREDNLKSIKYGEVVFVKADLLVKFFDQSYGTIENSFVLVTHNSDASAPLAFKNKLEDKKIIAWYASNPDMRNTSKLFPIPIGLANTRWPSGDLAKLTNAFQKHQKPWKNRSSLLYVNFDIGTNRKHRQSALSQATKFTSVTIVREKMTMETYLEHIGNAKFVLSPPGNGLDCHRTWEALLMGAVPVVLSSELDPLFKEIPVVIIDDWLQLTETFLLSRNFSSYDRLKAVVLSARFWRERLFEHRRNVNANILT